MEPHIIAAKEAIDSKFDVVHAHVSGLSSLGFSAAIAGARAGVPSVLTFHSMLDRTSVLLGASDALFGWTRGIVLTAVSSVVAAQAARAMAGVSVGVLPQGIGAPFWRTVQRAGPSLRSGRQKGASEVEIHFVSALESVRGENAKSLVRAFATAVRFVAGSPSMRLTIAGDASGARSIVRVATELGVGDRVNLTGQLSPLDRRTLYADADVFVLPGAREAFGLSALEARASGLPVIAMLSSGARDFITPGLNGLLARDAAEMARFMSRLAVEDTLRRFIANRNQTVAPPYDWPVVAEMHRAIYDAAAALRDAPAPTSHA